MSGGADPGIKEKPEDTESREVKELRSILELNPEQFSRVHEFIRTETEKRYSKYRNNTTKALRNSAENLYKKVKELNGRLLLDSDKKVFEEIKSELLKWCTIK